MVKEKITCWLCGKSLGYKPEDTYELSFYDDDIEWIDKQNTHICYEMNHAFCDGDCVMYSYDEECDGCEFECIHVKYKPTKDDIRCDPDCRW